MNVIIQDRWITSCLSKYGGLYMEPVLFAEYRGQNLTNVPRFNFGTTEQNNKIIHNIFDGHINLDKLKILQKQYLYEQQKKME